ncbi:GMC oxidoreductase [Nocardia pseudovaccinii]|uniref:GMC oxidoreductase n=1 Tax=Nocardia pseudovaccinii TaxID=189540 RepID=UPI001C3FD98E|nr:GMC oxidoreductase [Nocardia pseudovaccinii]
MIGTGFGGGVTAARLGRAGIDTLVLERGIRWTVGPGTDTFPHYTHPDRRAAWLSPEPVFTGSPPTRWKPFTGILDRVRGQGIDILCGAGVGGGSLVYGGTTIQPNERLFTMSMPSGLDFDAFDREYYPRVARVLKPSGIPDDILNTPQYKGSRIWADAIRAAGMQPWRVPLPVDWDYVRKELRGELPPSFSNGDILYGANSPGKNTVDKTYIAEAENSGHVEVAILHAVRDIARTADGAWRVFVDEITTDGDVRTRKEITTDALFLGAGSAGTSRLLVKAHAKGLIPDLPEDVGTRWGNNGDRIFSWTTSGESPGAEQGGPASVAVADWDNPQGPITLINGNVPFPVDIRTTSLIGFGIGTPAGRFVYDNDIDDAVLHWSQGDDAAVTAAIQARLQNIVGAGSVLLDTNTLDTTTYHPLGGAAIGSVCDTAGRVLGQKGLYVMDGALIPGYSGACNPSMTIAALAEHNMDTILKEDTI